MSVIRRSVAALAAMLLALAVVVALPGTSSALPPDGTMLTAGWETFDLYTVDPADAATTLVGDTEVEGIVAMAWDPVTQAMYAVDYDVEPASLYTIDPETGSSAVVGATDIADPTGLDAQPGTGVMFMVYDDPEESGSILATIDKATAEVTDIGQTLDGDAFVRLSGIAFDPTDGKLYGVSYNDTLYEIDPETGALTLLFDEVVEGYGLAFDCDGTFYASDADEDSVLYTIDLETGTATPVGSMDLEGDFSENLTVICGGTPPETSTTTSTTAAPTTTTTAAARAATVTPRFTG